ncbi:hypothetical protein AY601_3142 [Pedobacter cryoconitis]|uniref:Tetratricopeptide repeat protein n=1 Tax=Pedobacter cryoconitis TaxID=188932 RepID=A0A127VFB9_9SPHI|nr:hypothetical protein [Pedobacter cryoconitis]AMQ00014.1 hypothetical protein AY601_3142 [Pedobacter cryoconitis]
MRILLTVALFLSIAGISYGQNSTPQKAEAQRLINQAGDLMYDVGDGSLAQKNGNLKKSIILAKKAIELDSSRFVAYQILMGSYQMLHEPRGIINTCSEWLRNHPNDMNVRLRRGIIYHRTQKQNLADKDFKFVKDGLVKAHIKISNKLSEKEIAAIVSNAYTYLLIGEKKTSLNTMESLCKAFPNDKKLVETYKKIQTIDIEKESI